MLGEGPSITANNRHRLALVNFGAAEGVGEID